MKPFLLRPLGYMSSAYSSKEYYRENPHNGIDWVQGFKKTGWALADGVIYKLLGDGVKDRMVYHNVYQLCETPVGWLEIAYVHCWDFLVDEGDVVMQGQPIYLEGNTGKSVFVGGKVVTADEKYSGKGSHSHISVRTVERVKKTKKGEHYLETAKGLKYKDKEGFYYQIKNWDEVMEGRWDYYNWLFTPSKGWLLVQLSKVLGYVRHQA